MDEFACIVVCGEAGHAFLSMLFYPALDIVRDANVQNTRSASHDINVIGPHDVMTFVILTAMSFIT